jgi:hypothetical protein
MSLFGCTSGTVLWSNSMIMCLQNSLYGDNFNSSISHSMTSSYTSPSSVADASVIRTHSETWYEVRTLLLGADLMLIHE